MKRFATFTALLVFSVLGFCLLSTTSASAADLTWTGGGDGSTTADQSNWTPAQSPANGDTLIFPALDGVSSVNVTNNSAAVLNYMYFHRGATRTDYTVSGSVQTRNIIADNGGIVSFVGHVSFSQYSGATGSPYDIQSEADTIINIVGPNLWLGNSDVTAINIGGDGEVNISPSNVVDTSTVTTININGQNVRLGGDALNIPNTSLIVKQNFNVVINNNAWLGSLATALEQNASIGLKPGTQISSSLTLSAGALVYNYGGGPGGDIALTDSSTLYLNGEATFRSSVDNTNFLIMGDICNSVVSFGCVNENGEYFKISPADDSYGSVILDQAEGKNNASNMTNGESIDPPYQTEVISDTGNMSLLVRSFRIIVLEGTRPSTTVNNKGILKGTGNAGDLEVLEGGSVAPGNSPGILNSGNTLFHPGSIFEVEIAGAEAGSGYDQLKVTGTVEVEGSILDLIILDNFKPQLGSRFVIIDNDETDSVVGTFTGLSEGATITVDGIDFGISYVGGDGNDIELTSLTEGDVDEATANVPGTPNTGIQLLLANPLLTLVGTTASASGLFVLGRKYGIVR